VNHDPVEDPAPRLVLIESVVEEGAQEPSALGDPEGDGPMDLAAADAELRRSLILTRETASRIPAGPSPTSGGFSEIYTTS